MAASKPPPRRTQKAPQAPAAERATSATSTTAKSTTANSKTAAERATSATSTTANSKTANSLRTPSQPDEKRAKSTTKADRTALSRERLMAVAVSIADASGLEAVTMRSLAQEVGVQAMSLYHYVRNKEEILDGIVDVIFGEIDLPLPGDDWLAVLRRRAVSARVVLRRHPWATGLLESRTNPGPTTLHHHNATLGALLASGLSVELVAHAYALLDCYVYGFALQEAALPFDGPELEEDKRQRSVATVKRRIDEVAPEILPETLYDAFPNLAIMLNEHVLKPGYDFANEFEFGLDLILEGLERHVERVGARTPGQQRNGAGRKRGAATSNANKSHANKSEAANSEATTRSAGRNDARKAKARK